MKLEVISNTKVTLRQILSVWMPPPVIEDEDVLNIIRNVNEKADTQNNRVISSAPSRNGNGKDIEITVDSVIGHFEAIEGKHQILFRNADDEISQ